MLDLYNSLSAFLKLIVLIVGGTFILGIAIAPLWYGIPLIHFASDAICTSKKGLRYTIFGVFVVVFSILGILIDFDIRDIFDLILGVAFIIIGHNTRREYEEALSRGDIKI